MRPDIAQLMSGMMPQNPQAPAPPAAPARNPAQPGMAPPQNQMDQGKANRLLQMHQELQTIDPEMASQFYGMIQQKTGGF